MTISSEDIKAGLILLSPVISAVSVWVANKAREIGIRNSESLKAIEVKVDGRLDRALSEIEALKLVIIDLRKVIPEPKRH